MGWIARAGRRSPTGGTPAARGEIDRSGRVAKDEQVLVVERKVIEQQGMFHGLMFDVDRHLRGLFVHGVPRFMPRSQAETDPAYKQIIPYVIMMHQGKVLSYVRGRRAGEARLVGNRSIGIGGHINPADDLPLFNADFRQTYLAAVAREVAEEVIVDTGYTDHIVALLNDDSNPVGRVHLGIVHCWTLDAPKVARREQMITQLAFLSPAELCAARDSMETWSQLCLDGLDEMTRRLKPGPM
jgi:predicted NUDIX family phosphoesterase